MKRKGLKAFLALFAAFALCISQIGITTTVRAEDEGGTEGTVPGGPTVYTVAENIILNDNIDVDDVLIKSGVTLTIGEGGYLAANNSFVVEEGAKIVTELDYPVIEIREGVNNVEGFDRYVWNDQSGNYESYTGTGEAYVYQYMNIGNESSRNMAWVRQDIMGPGPLDWFSLEGTDYDKELQIDLNIPAEHGEFSVSTTNLSSFTPNQIYNEEDWEKSDKTANYAEFCDEQGNVVMTRLHVNNGDDGATATVELNLRFVDANQNFNFDVLDYYSEGDPTFRVERWMLEDPDYDFSGTPISRYMGSADGMSASITVLLTKEHTDVYLELCNGMRPGVSIRYDNSTGIERDVASWLGTDGTLTGIEADEYDPNMYVFTDAEAHSINFAGISDINNYKGFSYRVSESEWDSPDKTHISKAESLILNPQYFYDIELLVREEAPLYDNTYCASMENYDTGFEFTINGTEVVNNATVSYTGDSLTLGYTLPEGVSDVPYVLMRYEFGWDEEAVPITGNPTVVDTEGYPVFFNIFSSEAEYRYNRLNWDESTDATIEYYIGEHGSIAFTQNGSPLADKAHATYGGRTKLVVDKDAVITFTITAEQGYCIDLDHSDIRERCEGGENINFKDNPSGISNFSIADNGVSASGDWDVASLNDLRVEFKEAGGSESNPGEHTNPENPNPGEHTDPENPGHTFTAEDAKAAIENYLIAYAPAGGKTVAQMASDELWNVLFGTITDPQGNVRHVGDYSSFFENREAFGSAISIADESSTVSSEITKPGTSDKLPYYTFTLQITDEVTASGRIYVLDSEYDMIVRTVKGSSTSYQLITAEPYNETANTGCDPRHPYVMTCEYDMDNEGWPLVEVFGNGASFINISDSGNKAQCFGGHITGEQSGYWACKLSYKLEIYNSSFEGVKVTGNGGDAADGGQGLAAAWSWFEMDTIATNQTTSSKPVTYNIYVGNTKIYLDSVSTLGSKKKITNVVCSLPAAERAVRITGSGDRFIVEPLSTFYTELPLTVTYEGGATGYITINIVAMDIQDNTSPGGSNSIIINHGTDRDYSFDCPDRNAITATFYYTKDIDPATTGVSVILEATYTWKDGSVTRNTITGKVNRETWSGTAETEKVTADDFILWQGTADNKPVKIEVIALKPDTAADTFAGALFGGGAGITWTKD